MKALSCSTLIALAAISTPTASYANPIASPSLAQGVSISGTISVNIFGLGLQTCNVAMTGRVESMGSATVPGYVEFTSGSLSGAGCNSSALAITYPIYLKTISMTQVQMSELWLITPIATCKKSNVNWAYNNSTGVATIGPTSIGICTFSGYLQTYSSPLVIAP